MDWKALKDRWLSKKLAAFLLATALLWLKAISEATWETCALAYLGSQGLTDAAAHFAGKLPKKPKALDGFSDVMTDLLTAMTPPAPPPAPPAATEAEVNAAGEDTGHES